MTHTPSRLVLAELFSKPVRPLSIRITAAPSGEAPDFVRKAWIGIVLPLRSGHPRGPVEDFPCGIFSGELSFWGKLRFGVRNRFNFFQGYCVASSHAIQVLETRVPTAARWWREKCPQFLEPDRYFLFDSHVSLLLNEAGDPIPPEPAV